MSSSSKRRLRKDRLLLATGAGVLLIVVFSLPILQMFSRKIAPSTSPASSSQQTAAADTVCMTVGGDILLEEPILNYFNGGSWGDYMQALWPYFQQDDLTLVNMEVPIGGEELCITGIDYSFNSPTITASNVREQGIDAVSLANNHANDRGQQGIVNTHSALDAAGIDCTGTAASEEQNRSILSMEVNGIRIGIVSYTYSTNQPSEAGWSVNIFESAWSDRSDALIEDVRKASAENDAVIACLHWGTEFTYEPDENQKVLAQAVADAGADVIVGNHPHCIQPATWLDTPDGRRVLCFYSLGNLVSSAYQVDRADETFQNMYEVGAIAQFDLTKENDSIQLSDVQIIPFVNQFEGNYSSFRQILLRDYTEEQAIQHDQRGFSSLFTAQWLKDQVQTVYAPSGIPVVLE